MERIIQYEITDEFQGNTILQYLKKRLYTDKAVIALKKTPEGILLNNTWAYVNQKISSGDILTVKLAETECSENVVPEPIKLDIVYEDEDILVVNKPANMPVHPSQNHYTGTLANGAAYYFAAQDKPYIFRCVNRLDRDTTGLTILCKHQLASGILSNMVSKRLIKRTYLAICVDDGSLHDKGVIDAPIARKEGSTIERIVDFQTGERAVTHYEKIRHFPEKQVSLISLQLETGRTHQIRVHMTHIGHPLVGDDLYGAALHDASLHDVSFYDTTSYDRPSYDATSCDEPSHASSLSGHHSIDALCYMDRQALHSYSLRFIHPVTLQEMYFEQALPEDMASIINEQ